MSLRYLLIFNGLKPGFQQTVCRGPRRQGLRLRRSDQNSHTESVHQIVKTSVNELEKNFLWREFCVFALVVCGMEKNSPMRIPNGKPA